MENDNREAGGKAGKRTAVAVAVLALCGTLTAGAFTLRSNTHKPPAAPTTAANVATTAVVRTDLSDSQTLPGTLGFGTPISITGAGTGVVTGLPATGATIARGGVLYRADDQPVAVFYGNTALYRTLSAPNTSTHVGTTGETDSADTGGGQGLGQTPTRTPTQTPPAQPPGQGTTSELSGRDVTLVAQNLKALGYSIGSQPSSAASTGDVYTPALATAVERWQRHIGMAVTGTLGVGQIVVLSGPAQVSAVTAQLGDPVAEPLLSVVSTTKTVTVPVDPADATGIATGAKVTISLPGGKQIPGTVTAVSQSVQSGSQDSSGQTGAPTVGVVVTPAAAADIKSLSSAPVQVTFTTTALHAVLAVPVTALVALLGGGYGLELPNGTMIAVQTGLFADNGMVQVSGNDVVAGLKVQTAS